jgi:DNA-binding SARP family transcriptional activator
MAADSKPSPLRIGCDSVAPPLRVYLTGEVCFEAPGGRLLVERALPGPQAVHLLALLAAEHTRALGHDEIADELWDGAPPRTWQASLKALVSRVRAALAQTGFDAPRLLVGAPGVYRFRLPEGGWVDLDAARRAIHDAETRFAAGDADGAARQAFVARLITARPLLPGHTGPWLEQQRRALADLRIRTLECSARAHLARGAPAGAVRDAQLVLDSSPLREPAWRLLMDAHAAAGDTASAIAAFARCQGTLREALGVGPSVATRARHEALLSQTG